MLYWIWLSLSVTPGGETFGKLLQKYNSARQIYDLDSEEIRSVVGERSKDYRALIDKDTSRAQKILDFCASKNIGLLAYGDEKYPDSLRKIKSPPVLLYYRGNFPDFNERVSISVVGTRRLSDYGRRNAFLISRELSLSGAIIVSGMAIGVDGVAHAGALSTNGTTVAVLGSGIDVCYPAQHKTLARAIVKNGCVITEYPLGTKPERHNFPKRNRIISGLSCGTLLIEGSEKSGALITARLSAEQGRAVYALPGNVGNKNSEASNLLIKNGARLVTSASDIITDFDSIEHGLLNPFNLPLADNVDMFKVLTEYAVSCVCTDDAVFRNKKPKSAKAKVLPQAPDTPSQKTSAQDSVTQERERELRGFDKMALAVYKKIPVEGECLVEDIVDDKITLPMIMSALLKLEVAKFIVMLPGGRVKRI